MPRFWICQCSEYVRVLNMPSFWIYQGSEYVSVLNIPGFWICQGSEYAKVLNMPGFWIYQGSEYARGLNILRFWIKMKINNSFLWRKLFHFRVTFRFPLEAFTNQASILSSNILLIFMIVNKLQGVAINISIELWLIFFNWEWVIFSSLIWKNILILKNGEIVVSY